MIKQRLFFPLMVILLLQAACSPATPEILATSTAPATSPVALATETPAASATSVATTAPVTGACSTPAAGQGQLVNQEDGYCMLYPAEYATQNGKYIIINPVTGPGDVLGEAWVSIYMEGANGRTAAEVADAEISAWTGGFNIERSETTVGGDPAIVVDGLPGPDPLRRVFVVHADRLYTLIFLPWTPGAANSGQSTQLEGLYEIVMESMQFLTPTKPLPTPTQPWGPANLPPPLTFETPQDGQVIDYQGDYFFQVTDIGADGYLWSFSQNGVLVWENLRDEMGLTAGGTYAILKGSEAHNRFVPGPVEVSVQAKKGDYLTEPTIITIVLQ